MNAEPHAVGSHAFKLVAVLADLGYCGIPANHRHDPFIMVLKRGTRCAFNVGQNILGCQPPALLCYRAKLWQSVSVLSRDVSEVADGIDTWEALNAKIVLNLDSPTASLWQPQVTSDRRGLETRSPDHATALDGAAVGQYDVAWMHFLNVSVEFENHTAALQNLTRVIMSFGGERREERGAMLNQVDVGGFDETFIFCRGHRMKHVGHGSGHLGARRSAAHDHDVQRALLDELGFAISFFKQGQEPRAQALGIDQRIERKAIYALPEKLRRVVEIKELQDRTIEEAASLLGISAMATKMQCSCYWRAC